MKNYKRYTIEELHLIWPDVDEWDDIGKYGIYDHDDLTFVYSSDSKLKCLLKAFRLNRKNK